MKNNFQTIVIIVFIVAAVFGVLVFSGAIPIGKDTTAGSAGTVVLWATVPTQVMSPLVEAFNAANPTFILKYVEKAASTFDQDLLEALASQTGPDLFFLPDNLAVHYSGKLFTIPYSSYPLVNFRSNFAGAGEVFLTSQGVLAFPITIDPMVMYYNRSILDANSLIYPPKTWDELVTMVPKLTKKDDTSKITKSTVALGQFSNVAHAKDIISTLFMQGGNKIVAEKEGKFISTLDTASKYDLNTILKFYTDFADPLNQVYSWNKSFPNSVDAFSAENVALYFGYASELQSLVNKNPNQNFSMAPIPQIQGSTAKLTGARVTGIAISAFSKNFNSAFIAAGIMSSGDFAKSLAAGLSVAPARRDLLSTVPGDSFSPTFYASAIFARSWLDPSPKDSDIVFKGMVESVISNNATVADAIREASSKINLLLLK
jgi:ABC-type glycerol-3-phosphate transport system substrate-binding protein